jgi:hypothetical protein
LWFNISVLKVNNSLNIALAFTLSAVSILIYSVPFVDLPHLAHAL